MTVIARGAAQVRAYERAIGGDPPEADLERIRDAFVRRAAEQAQKRQEISEQQARIVNPITEQLLENHPQLRAQHEAFKRELLQQPGHLTVPRSSGAESQVESQVMTPAAIQLVKAPPYDWDASWTSPGDTSASADKDTGQFNTYAKSYGEFASATAALGVWFYATADNQAQRFAAYIKYTDLWQFYAPGDTSCWVGTTLEVWGNTEQAVVATAVVAPNPSAGGSYFENNSDYGNPDMGAVSSEIYFPAKANRWYLAKFEGSAGGQAGGSIFGPGHASMNYFGSVPFVVFGSL